jgi:hypothetical protein
MRDSGAKDTSRRYGMASALVPGIYTRLVIIGVAVSVDRRDTGSFAFAKDEIGPGFSAANTSIVPYASSRSSTDLIHCASFFAEFAGENIKALRHLARTRTAKGMVRLGRA